MTAPKRKAPDPADLGQRAARYHRERAASASLWFAACALSAARDRVRCTRADVELAGRELARVHATEQARLLGEAARLFSPGALANARHRSSFRRRLREELRTARADGIAVPFELALCELWPPQRWVSPTKLAEVAVGLAETPAALRTLAWVRALERGPES